MASRPTVSDRKKSGCDSESVVKGKYGCLQPPPFIPAPSQFDPFQMAASNELPRHVQNDPRLTLMPPFFRMPRHVPPVEQFRPRHGIAAIIVWIGRKSHGLITGMRKEKPASGNDLRSCSLRRKTPVPERR